jgi:hypothetical protein
LNFSFDSLSLEKLRFGPGFGILLGEDLKRFLLNELAG